MTPLPPPSLTAAPPRTLSLTALILGAGGLLLGWTLLGLPSLAAVVLGHLALKREPEGRTLATTGLVLGWVGIAAAIGIAVLVVLAIVLPFAFLATYPALTRL